MRITVVLLIACNLLNIGIAGAGDVDILLLIPHRYGANYNFNSDQFEKFGWNITTAAVTDSVQPCHGGLPYLHVDTLVQEIDDVTQFDALAIMSATWRYQADPYGDLIASSESMQLIVDATDADMPVYAPCVAPRVLAAADLLDGVSMQGEPGSSDEYLAEYLAAGAVYLGTHLPPVICGNIVTATRGQYYQRENSQAIGTAMIPDGSASETITSCPAGLVSGFVPCENTLWSMTTGGAQADGAEDIEETEDNGLIIAGYTYSSGNGNSDMVLVKTDSEGTLTWSKTFGGSGWEYGNSVCQTQDGGYVVAGYTTSSGCGLQDVLVVKTDSQGNQEWTATCGGTGLDIGMSVLETDAGEILVCGYTESFGVFENDIYLVKLSSDGSQLWEKTYGGRGLETGDCVLQLSDGNYLIAGATGSRTINSDAVLVKTDTDGNQLWSCYYNGGGGEGGYDRGNAVCTTAEGGFAIAGDSNEPDKCGVMFVTTDSSGVEQNMEFHGGSSYDYGNDIVDCSDGGFLICGATKDHSTCLNCIYAVKVNSSGILVWEESFGDGSGSQWGEAICATSDGNYVIAGQTETEGSGRFDIWILKIEDPFFGIEEADVPVEFGIFPNPATSEVTIYPELAPGTTVRIFDISSRCILETESGNESGSIDISSLPSGMYIMSATAGSNCSSSQFVVLER